MEREQTERDRIKREVREGILSVGQLLLAELTQISEELFRESEFEEEEIITYFRNPRRRVPRIENYVEEIVTSFTREEFKANFRMFPETYRYILSKIEDRLKRKTKGMPMISTDTQLLLTLWRLGTPDSFRSICERFGVGRSTAYYIPTRIVIELAKLAPTVIKWPAEERMSEVWTGFERSSWFPKVIGVIDGTHINIPAPKEHPETYVNRKSQHLMQLQAVCDHKCRFIHCFVGHVGSVHDNRVFKKSDVIHYLGDIRRFPEDSHLVGDLAYTLHENLLTPYHDDGYLTNRQKNYNFCQSSARIAIERAFGLLKDVSDVF